MTRAGPLVPIVLLTLLPSCGKAHERSGKNARADSGVDAGLTVIDPASGQPVLLAPASHLPDGFPKSIPLYPGAKVVGAVTSNDSGKRINVVSLFSSDSVTQVDDFYRTHVKGMQTVKETSDADTRSRVLEDPAGKLRVTLVATRSGPGTSVQITTIES